MLGTAVFLRRDILVFWHYAKGKGWIRYAASDKGGGQREAFLVQCVYSERYQAFHCEPTGVAHRRVSWQLKKFK